MPNAILSKNAIEGKTPFSAVDLDAEFALMMVDREIGNNVVICVTSEEYKRDDFHPQISIEGNLEGKKGYGNYRVLLSNSSYSYFSNDVVMGVVKKKDRAVIYLDLTTHEKTTNIDKMLVNAMESMR